MGEDKHGSSQAVCAAHKLLYVYKSESLLHAALWPTCTPAVDHAIVNATVAIILGVMVTYAEYVVYSRMKSPCRVS